MNIIYKKWLAGQQKFHNFSWENADKMWKLYFQQAWINRFPSINYRMWRNKGDFSFYDKFYGLRGNSLAGELQRVRYCNTLRHLERYLKIQTDPNASIIFVTGYIEINPIYSSCFLSLSHDGGMIDIFIKMKYYIHLNLKEEISA